MEKKFREGGICKYFSVTVRRKKNIEKNTIKTIKSKLKIFPRLTKGSLSFMFFYFI